MTISYILKQIAASLWIKPATFEELRERDFLNGIAEHVLDRLLMSLEKDKKIYERGKKYYTYRAYAISEDMHEFELSTKNRYKRPS